MKSHQFESISEEQWRSGLSRHCCALCSQDYDDAVHCRSSWPLVIVIEDCYVPQWAQQVVKLAVESGIETAHAVITALAVYAELGLRGEKLN